MDEFTLKQNSLKIVESKISSTEEIHNKLEKFSISDLHYLENEIKKELIEIDKNSSIYDGQYKLSELFYLDNELAIWDGGPVKLRDISDHLRGKVFRTIVPFRNYKAYLDNKVNPNTVIPEIEKEYLYMHDLHKKWRIILTYLSSVRVNLARPTIEEAVKQEKIIVKKHTQYFKKWKQNNKDRYEVLMSEKKSPTDIADLIINEFDSGDDYGFRSRLIDAIKQDLTTKKAKKKSKRKY